MNKPDKPLELLLGRPKMCSIPFQNKIADPLSLEHTTLCKHSTFTLYTELKDEFRVAIQKNQNN